MAESDWFMDTETEYTYEKTFSSNYMSTER